MRVTREPRRSSSGTRSPGWWAAVVAVVVAAPLVPAFGLERPGAENAAFSLVVLGHRHRRHAGAGRVPGGRVLVAENGVYLAGLAVAGGLPGAIELGLLFDLLVIVAVAAAFGSKIHEEFGSGDTGLLRRSA